MCFKIIFFGFLIDTKEKVSTGGEMSMSEKKTLNGTEVVIQISGEETPKAKLDSTNAKESSSEATTEPTTAGTVAKSVSVSCPSTEISRFSPSPDKPPKIPTANEAILRQRRSLKRSAYSKPKSRFGEQPYKVDASMLEENDNLASQEQVGVNSPCRNYLTRGSPNNKYISSIVTNPITPRTPVLTSPGGAWEDENEEIYKKVELSKQKRKKVKTKVLIEWVAFLCIVVCLVASLTVDKLENSMIWELEVWKWCVLVLVIFSGMLVTNWIMHFVVFLIEKNFLLKKKVLYFVHGLKKSVQVFIWLALVLLTWVFLFKSGVKRTEFATKVLDYITMTLITILIGAFLWLLKTLLLKILASNFHVNRFFDRIQESVFYQYVLQTLSGPPLIEEAQTVGKSASTGQLSFCSKKKCKEAKDKKTIDMGKFHKIKQEKVTAWTMKVLVDAIMNSRLTTISNTLDETVEDIGGEQADKEITNEMEATAAAFQIFKNVAQPGSK